jgi:hypothetical protein
MVFKVETVVNGRVTILRLNGRIESEHVQALKTQMNAIEQTIVFDLENVRLLDLDAAHFFANCEAAGIELRHCPPYVREWILSERRRITGLE